MEICQNCKYWDSGKEDNGPCRRRAPVATGGMSSAETIWPQVGSYDWCGEFEAQSDKRPPKPWHYPSADESKRGDAP
jgi:hypothetical protein